MVAEDREGFERTTHMICRSDNDQTVVMCVAHNDGHVLCVLVRVVALVFADQMGRIDALRDDIRRVVIDFGLTVTLRIAAAQDHAAVGAPVSQHWR